VRACKRFQKFVGRWDTTPYRMEGLADPLETRYSYTCVIVLNSVALDQSVWAQVGVPKIWRKLGLHPLGRGRG